MKQIDFYGDKLDVVEMEDPIFNCVDINTVGADGKQREMLVMPVKSIPVYLFSINPNKVREDLR